MNSAAFDIQQQLIDQGVLVPIFVNSEPTKPNEVITIYDTAGDPPNPKWLLDTPEIQIRSRSKDQAIAYSNLRDIRDRLLGISQFAEGSSFYIGIWAKDDIGYIGQDESNRSLLTINLRLVRQPDTGEHREPLTSEVSQDIQDLFDLFGGPAQYQVYIDDFGVLVNDDYPASGMGV